MNHSEAIKTNAAEAYLLGDMADADREAFEEHYVDCSVCSNTVFSGAAMLATGKKVVESEKTFRRVSSRSWIPASVASAAATALFVVAGYQSGVIPQIQSLASAPHIEVVTQNKFVRGTVRSGSKENEVHLDAKQPVAAITIDMSMYPTFPRYVIELRDASGKLLKQLDVSAAQSKNENGVLFLLRLLPAGRHVLVTSGVRKDGNHSEISRTLVVVK